MSQLIVTTFVSLDGVAQGPGGQDEDRSGGFEVGGWLVPFVDEGFGTQVVEWFAHADAFLLGRRTYEIFAGHWPRVTDPNDPIATALNRLPKYVASRTLESADWNGSRVIRGDVAAEVRRLKAASGREIQVHGSLDLVRTLSAHDLVDEHRILTFPVILGRGKRLFEPGVPPTAFSLAASRTTPAGVTCQVFRRAGAMQYGRVPDPVG